MKEVVNTVNHEIRAINRSISEGNDFSKLTIVELKEELSKADLHISDLLHLLEFLENKEGQPMHELDSSVVEILLEVSLSLQRATRKRRNIKNAIEQLENKSNIVNHTKPSYRVKSIEGGQVWSRLKSTEVKVEVPVFIPSKFEDALDNSEKKEYVDLKSVNLPSNTLIKHSYEIQKLMFLFDIADSDLTRLEKKNNVYQLTDKNLLVFSSTSIEEVFTFMIDSNLKVYLSSPIQPLVFKQLSKFINEKKKLSKLPVFLERANNKFHLKYENDILIENSKLSYILKRIKNLPLSISYDYRIAPIVLESQKKYPEMEMKCFVG